MNSRYYPRRLFAAPVEEPLSREEIADHCRISATDPELATVIDSYAVASREHVEEVCGRQFITATWDVYPPGFPCEDYIELPFGQLQSVDLFSYTDTSLTATPWTISGGDLHDSSGVIAHINSVKDPARLVLAFGEIWPAVVLKTSNPIAIRITCGYGAANAVPQIYKQAMRLLISHWNENREGTTVGTLMMSDELKLGVKEILGTKRIYGF